LPVENIELINISELDRSSKQNGTKRDSMTTTMPNDCCEWCYKCKRFFENCKEVAQKVGIVVVEGLYQTKITLLCEKKNHLIKISYSKKLHTLSCSDCRKEEREEWKEQLKQEEARRNEMYQKK
jgi:hypothetical protein